MQIPADAGEQILSPVLVAAKDFDIEIFVMPGWCGRGQVGCMPARNPPRESCSGQGLRAEEWTTVRTGRARCFETNAWYALAPLATYAGSLGVMTDGR